MSSFLKPPEIDIACVHQLSFMPMPPGDVGKNIMFLYVPMLRLFVCLSFHPFVHPDRSGYHNMS